MLALSACSQVMAAARAQTLPDAQPPALTDIVFTVVLSSNSTAVPAAPVIIGPADKTLVPIDTMMGVPEVVVLAWNRAADATRHTVQVSDDSAFTQIIYTITVDYPALECSIGQGNNNTITALGKTYYWRVRASAPFESPYSEVRSFTCRGISTGGPPIMPSPMNGASITNQNPEFKWPPLADVTRYEFQLSTVPTFNTLVYTVTSQTAGILIPGIMKLEVDKQYFWRVRALEPVQGNWSSLLNFMVISPTSTIRLPSSITNIPTPAPTLIPGDTKVKLSIWQRVINFLKNLFAKL